MTITASHEVVAETRAGRVILLNGTSSSGKSSIAAELLDQLDGPWFHLGIDGFHRLRSRQDGPKRSSCRSSSGPCSGSTGPSPGWWPPATTL